MYQVYFGKRLFWHYCLQLSFVCKIASQNSFKLFCSGNKRLLSELLSKWGWFQGHNERFPKYLDLKLKSQKTETQFCRWKSTDNNDINIFLSLENPCTTKNWLFNDVWCYLLIACFDWKIGIFQKTVVRA